jgi:hypothetical protein
MEWQPFIIQLRLSATEKEAVKAAATGGGRSVSELSPGTPSLSRRQAA